MQCMKEQEWGHGRYLANYIGRGKGGGAKSTMGIRNAK